MNVCESNSKISVVDPMCNVPSCVKKRREERHNEVTKSQRNANPQFCYGDRFIPKRFKRENTDFNLKYVGINNEKDILKTDVPHSTSYWRQNNYAIAMNNTFDIRKARLLQYNNLNSQFMEQSRSSSTYEDWPCMPRSRPMAFPNATHELPDLCISFDQNLMDWSINGQIAVSFGQDLIIWRNLCTTTMVFSVRRPRSLKYSPNGKYLAIGCIDHHHPAIELWLLKTKDEFLVSNGKYFDKSVEAICCIEWRPDSQVIVCGTNKGLILVINATSMVTMHKIETHKHKISGMRFSPTGRYLATADVKGHICIFDGTQYKKILRLGSKGRGVVFDWHPWSDVELAVAAKTPSSIYIVNVQRRETVAFYQRGDKEILINSISFSKLTGELLVNIYKRDNTDCLCCEILVLSSLNRVVDILGDQERGSLFMMWSPDGTQVATAGLDESFSIWNFYPTDNIDAKKHPRKEEEPPSCLELYRLFK